jgi:hypothetical protein
MRRPLHGRTAFWLPLMLQTVALLTAANANEMAQDAAAPKVCASDFMILDTDADAFVYTAAKTVSPLWLDDDYAEPLGAPASRAFEYPVLLQDADRMLLGGLDYLDRTEPGDDDWLLSY